MTTLIKSNNIAENTIGHVSGFQGPSDFIGFLDFNRGDYLTVENGKVIKHSLEDSVICTRSGVANSIDEDCNVTEVASDTPRITYNTRLNRYGLAGENNTTNLVANPSSPANQTISFANGSNNEPISLQVVGSGSARLTGSGVDDLGYSIQGKPLVYRRIGSTSFDAQLEITGDVSFVQVEKSFPSTFIENTRNFEILELSSTFVSLLKEKEFTVVVSQSPLYAEQEGQLAGSLGVEYVNGNLLAVKTSETKDGSSTDSLVAKVSGVETNVQNVVGRGVGGNYSISRKNTNYGFTAIRDAEKTIYTFPDSGTISKIYPMGRAGLGGVAGGSTGGTCQYIAIYDRFLTDQELANCAFSPIVY